MELEIRRIKNAGTEEECLVLRVNSECNSGNFLLFDETYIADNTTSNKARHLYIFAPHALQEGDFIWLFTHKEGEYSTHHNTSNTTTHKFYWGLGNSVWNNNGDKIYVVHYDEWIMKSKEADQ